MTTSDKFLRMGLAILLFVVIVAVILFIANRFSGRRGDRAVATAFLLPMSIMLAVGLLLPGDPDDLPVIPRPPGHQLHRVRQLPDDLHQLR